MEEINLDYTPHILYLFVTCQFCLPADLYIFY